MQAVVATWPEEWPDHFAEREAIMAIDASHQQILDEQLVTHAMGRPGVDQAPDFRHVGNQFFQVSVKLLQPA